MRYGYAGVILAAGASERMGRDKALLPLPGGGTFLSGAINMLRPVTQLVIVVAGANAQSIQSVVYAQGGFLVVNPEPGRGQFSSLQVGLQAVLSHGRDSAIITHVDRLPVAAATITTLMAEFEAGHASAEPLRRWAIVPEATDKSGERRHGHPIIVGREMMEVFLKAPVTSTARAVEHQHQPRIRYLPVEDANILANINTPEDYEASQS